MKIRNIRTKEVLGDVKGLVTALAFLFFLLFSFNNGFAADPPEGPVPSVQASETDGGGESFSPGGDAPLLYPSHPPIDQIPPLPMPEPPVSVEPFDSSTPAGSGIIYNPSTGEETVIPPQDSASSDEPAQGGGYNGPDGVGNEDIGLEAMFADMYQITNTGDFPWRMNCKLVMRFGTSWYVASGSMIDAETVLTAGHCVNQGGGGSWADEIWVYPGYDGTGWDVPPPYTVGAYGWGHGTYFASWSGWTVDGNFDYDLGVVRITRGVGMLTGWYGWAYGGNCDYHTGLTYNNASYPAENCPLAGLHNGLDMYYWSGHFDACPGNQLQLYTGGGHCFDTVWGGMSGSGAYFIDTNRYVHAVCSTSNRYDRGNYCRQFEAWVTFVNSNFIPGSRGSSFDLQALDLNAEPSTILAGTQTTLLNHFATNPTNGTASSTWTFRVYLSTNDNISSSDTLLSTQHYTRTFGAMSSTRVNMVQVTIPVDTPEGDYWLGVIYDSATDGVYSNNDTSGWDAVPIHVTAASVYDYCFESAGAKREFDKEGIWLIGQGSSAGCGTSPLLGWVYGSRFALNWDIDSSSSCTESVFYLSHTGDLSYHWINTDGGKGTGTMTPCSSVLDEGDSDETSPSGEGFLDGAGTYCFTDNYGYTHNLVYDDYYITGTLTTTSCGTVPLIGAVEAGIFSYYCDIPSGTGSCVEGLLYVGKVSTKRGYLHNGLRQYNFNLSSCTMVEPTPVNSDVDPCTGP